MHFENTLTTAQIGSGHHHLPIKAAGPQQSGIEHVRTVGCRNKNDAFIGFKAVHFHQQLIKSLLAFIMTAAQPRATLAAHRVDFVDKNQAGGVFLALGEQVAHAGSADAHEHFHKIRAGYGEERHSCLPGHGPGQQRLACSRRADEQHALGDTSAKPRELARIGQEFHHFSQLFLGFIHAGNIGESDLGLILRHHAGARAPERHGLAPAALHLAHEENPYSDKQQHGEPGNKQAHGKGRLLRSLGLDADIAFQQMIDQSRIIGSIRFKALPRLILTENLVPLDAHILHLTPVYLSEKITVGKRLLRGIGLVEQVEEHHHRQRDERPKQQITGKLIQSCLRGCLFLLHFRPQGRMLQTPGALFPIRTGHAEPEKDPRAGAHVLLFYCNA